MEKNSTIRQLGVTEVAARLGVARRTVLQRVQTGALTPVGQLSGRTGAYLFDAEEIDRIAATTPGDLRRHPAGKGAAK